MIRKTEAIVLRTQKFQESSLLTTCYTREYGIQNFIVQGYRSTRGKKTHSYFQPMSVIDIVFYYKETRDLQKITESSVNHFLTSIQTHPARIPLGMLVVEIFTTCVKEHEKNEPLYFFLKNTLIHLDTHTHHLIHRTIWFLLHLTGFLGFLPSDDSTESEKNIWFDPQSGLFLDAPGPNPSARILRDFFHSESEESTKIQFSNEEKREIITILFDYYRIHVSGFKEPESVKVFSEVFGRI